MKRFILLMMSFCWIFTAAVAQNIKGDWFAQIDIPQNELSILLEFNLLESNNCVVTCTWTSTDTGRKRTETGKAKYQFKDNELTIKFLNEDQLIRHDHVFRMNNVYKVRFDRGKMVIYDCRAFRNVDTIFGRGYKNRGFCKITF